MKTTKEHIKILSTLSLAASDTREDTLKSVVISTLLEVGEIKEDEISDWIEEAFGFKPYSEELAELIEQLDNKGEIDRSATNLVKLNEEARLKFSAVELDLKDKEKARFQNFSSFINGQLNNIGLSKQKLLWATFIEYLYNHFYDYGEEALKRLHPHINYDKVLDKEDNYQEIAFSKLKDPELCSLFRLTVEQFPNFASIDDIDFLHDLAQKTLSFASLGIDPNLSQSTLDLSLIDWVLYLDTNVLYSLLNLHSHPENEACKALITLINDNKDHLKIVLRYSEFTMKELNSKRGDFNLLNDKLASSSIKALLRSDKLDDFSKQFYQNLLDNRESTIHPSQVIDLSNRLLLKDEIDIARNAKRLEQIEDGFLDAQIQDYRRFIDEKNEVKQTFCEKKKISFHPIYKSDKQIIHDITLRELLLHLRGSFSSKKSGATFNSMKYFGITLDSLLRSYDTRKINDYNDERSFPVFFRPSFLLSKLVKVLPIQTNDYKKAFIKAVTSKGFNKDVTKSRDVLRVVNFLNSQGINDEKVVYNLISEDLFLEKYSRGRKKKEFNERDLIESELSREFKIKEKELIEAKTELGKKSKEADKTGSVNIILEGKTLDLETEVSLLKSAISMLNIDIVRLTKRASDTSQQPQLNFEAAEARGEHDKTKTVLKEQIEGEIDSFRRSELERWKKKIWWNLFWVIPFTIFTLGIILVPSLIPESTFDVLAIRIILAVFLLFFDGIFINLIRVRYWDEGNKQKKMENIKVPYELTNKLSNI